MKLASKIKEDQAYRGTITAIKSETEPAEVKMIINKING